MDAQCDSSLNLQDQSCSYSPSNAELTGFRFCRRVLGYTKVTSTNSLALEWARKKLIQPETLILADEQTSGRGRLSHSWYSPPEMGIYASLLLEPMTEPGNRAFITLAAGLAIYKVIEELLSHQHEHLDIKWPNDILWKGKKVAGILAESEIREDVQQHIVVGFGINVANKEFPQEINSRAVSLYQITGQVFPRHDLLLNALRQLDEALSCLQRGDYREIRESWESASSFVRGRKVKFFNKGTPVMGITSGLKADVALRIITRHQEQIDLYSGEIFEY